MERTKCRELKWKRLPELVLVCVGSSDLQGGLLQEKKEEEEREEERGRGGGRAVK